MDADQVNSLVAKAQAEALARRQAAAEELHGLLLQQGKPTDGDEKHIADCLEVLGVGADKLPEILDIVTKLDRYEALMADLPARTAAVGATHCKLAEFDQETEALRARMYDERMAKREPLAAAESRATCKQNETREAQQWLSTYRAKWQGIVEGISHEEILEHNRPRGTPHGAPAMTSQ
jgi:hypothetical protein